MRIAVCQKNFVEDKTVEETAKETYHYLNYLLLSTLLPFWEVDISMLTASWVKEILLLANVPASGYRP